MLYLPAQQKPPYGNCMMIAPNGTVLCRCDQKKVDWYLSRGLAEIVGHDPVTIRLNFTPKGDGQSGDPYYLSEKENICVCCGSITNLTKHHCIPRCFRKHFPDEYKNHCCHDVVLLCVDCHAKYEPESMELKRELAHQYQLPPPCKELASAAEQTLHSAIKAAKALLLWSAQIPPARIEELSNIVRDYLKRDFWEEDLKEICYFVKPELTLRDALGKAVVSKLDDIPKFICMWREHFVRIMYPQHLPLHWSVDHQDSPHWQI